MCQLLDIACHVQGAAWEWWAGVGLINKVLIVGGIVLIILGALRTLLAILHRVGGWPAVVGAVLAIVGLVAALLPRPPRAEAHENVDGADAAPPPSRPKRRKTLQDLFRDGLK